MSEVYEQLTNALTERIDIINDEKSRQAPEAHMKRLQEVSERIEALEQRLPEDADPQLRHYLQRRSYTKALEYLSASSGRGLA